MILLTRQQGEHAERFRAGRNDEMRKLIARIYKEGSEWPVMILI